MGKRISLSIAILCFVVYASPAYAALIDRGTGMIYDTDLGITWLQDANYAQTSGYDADGMMSWNDAISWADQLNYGGYEDWRLPTNLPVGTSYNYTLSYDGSTDMGYNITSPSSEMSYMYYVTLGNKGYYDVSGSSAQPGWGLTNTGPFLNLQRYMYWSGTSPYEPSPVDHSWAFNTYWGEQTRDGSLGPDYAWAVRDGDFGPSVSTDSDYVTSLILGDTFSFDYWWEMAQEPDDFNLDILFFRDNSWQLLGGDLNLDGSSNAWATRSFAVPEELRGLNTQIRFMVYDLGADTDPTVYLRNIASNGTAPVPEPTTLILLGSGLLGLAGMRKKLKG